MLITRRGSSSCRARPRSADRDRHRHRLLNRSDRVAEEPPRKKPKPVRAPPERIGDGAGRRLRRPPRRFGGGGTWSGVEPPPGVTGKRPRTSAQIFSRRNGEIPAVRAVRAPNPWKRRSTRPTRRRRPRAAVTPRSGRPEETTIHAPRRVALRDVFMAACSVSSATQEAANLAYLMHALQHRGPGRRPAS
jgi:hypothetical protein